MMLYFSLDKNLMKSANPFPSLSLLLPDDIEEDTDSTVASYWRHDDTCLL
jgi:hypothetical protein